MRIDGNNVELIAFLLCDSVVKDASSGNTTIQNIFDTVYTPGVPALKQAMTAFFRIKVDDPSAKLSPSLTINNPSGLRNSMPTLPPMNLVQGKMSEANIVLQGMIFPEFGNYSIDLLLNGVRIASYPIIVQRFGVQSSGSGTTIH